jgi:hypothetical protein
LGMINSSDFVRNRIMKYAMGMWLYWKSCGWNTLRKMC